MKNETSQPWSILRMDFSDHTAGRHAEAFWGRAVWSLLCSASSNRHSSRPNGTAKIHPGWHLAFAGNQVRSRRKGGSSQLGIGGHAHDITVQEGRDWPMAPRIPSLPCHSQRLPGFGPTGVSVTDGW